MAKIFSMMGFEMRPQGKPTKPDNRTTKIKDQEKQLRELAARSLKIKVLQTLAHERSMRAAGTNRLENENRSLLKVLDIQGEKYHALSDDLDKIRKDFYQADARKKVLETQNQVLSEQIEALEEKYQWSLSQLETITEKYDGVVELNNSLQSATAQKIQEYEKIRMSKSFRVGRVLANSTLSFRNLLRVPTELNQIRKEHYIQEDVDVTGPLKN